MAMELVETIEVGSGGASSIEFTSIPQTGVDLLLVCSLRMDNTSTAKPIYVNGDTGANYLRIQLAGTGSSVANLSSTNSFFLTPSPSSSTSNTFGNNALYFSNYTASQNKSISVDGVSENNATGANQRIIAGQWTNTNAITSIELSATTANFVQYSSASLYIIS